MVQCLSAFMEACYIVRQNAISAPMLDRFQECVDKFHELHNIFIALSVTDELSNVPQNEGGLNIQQAYEDLRQACYRLLFYTGA